MSCATRGKFALRASLFYIFLLASSPIFGSITIVQVVPTPLPVILGGPVPIAIPETLPEPVLLVTIPGAVFAPGAFPSGAPGGEIDMFEFGPGGPLSDRIVFDNSGPGGIASIMFISDGDPLGIDPRPVYPALLPPQGELASITLPIIDLNRKGMLPLTIQMESDPEQGPALLPPNLSDRLTLSISNGSIPEPSSISMAAAALAALSALALRRHRR